MNIETIARVKEVLANPKHKLNELYQLCKELCNHLVNLNCSSCITDGVLRLSNWIKTNGVELEHQVYFRKAVSGEYELKPINLFVQVYDCGNAERQKELDACLSMNKKRNHFYRVIEITDRLTYNEIFKLTEEYTDCINVIANSDIYFDETILMTRFMEERTCYALSRWDYSNGLAVLLDRKDSQDAWIFNGAAKQVAYGEFHMGIPGCDNRIAYEIKETGIKVLNPSKTIHAIHLHNSEYRTYGKQTKSVADPYYLIEPHY